MNDALKDFKIAAIATHGFEKSELIDPVQGFREAGATVEILGPSGEKDLKGWSKGEWSGSVPVDRSIEQANPGDYDALFIPGGTLNTDKLRMDRRAVEFTRTFAESAKPIATICHGPQMLIEAGQVKGKRMTSYSAIKTDLLNAGAEWVDEEVVIDAALITSRSPSDLPAFIAKSIEQFQTAR